MRFRVGDRVRYSDKFLSRLKQNNEEYALEYYIHAIGYVIRVNSEEISQISAQLKRPILLVKMSDFTHETFEYADILELSLAAELANAVSNRR